MRLLPILLLAGCANTSQVYTADGQTGHALNCSGLARSWNACFEAAGQICKERGYNVLSSSAERGAVAGATPTGAFGSTTQTRTMVIACK